VGYAGIVVGGPWAGKSYESRSSRFDLSIGPQVAMVPDGREIEPQRIAAQKFTYVFTEMFGVNMWVPRGWSQDDIAREVFGNYRPSAIREIATDHVPQTKPIPDPSEFRNQQRSSSHLVVNQMGLFVMTDGGVIKVQTLDGSGEVVPMPSLTSDDAMDLAKLLIDAAGKL
jgi:hypothetical protein